MFSGQSNIGIVVDHIIGVHHSTTQMDTSMCRIGIQGTINYQGRPVEVLDPTPLFTQIADRNVTV